LARPSRNQARRNKKDTERVKGIGMSEIEKMYKNAGVGYLMYVVDTFPPVEYPQINFNEKKQIELIKLISQQGQVIIENWEKDNGGFNVTFRANSNLRYITMDCITRKTFEEALAQIVNDIWQDLTEEEKQQVKGILE